MQDPLPIRLAGLAADLRRVSSSARHESGSASVAEMLEESQYYIEWTAAEADIEISAELVDMQRLIAGWRRAWPEAQKFLTQRTLLSIQARKWSDQALEYSGLVDGLSKTGINSLHDA